MTHVQHVRQSAPAAPAAPAAVWLDDVSVVYPDGTAAVRGVSLSVDRGSHLTLMGASGSGKTTLLACIAGRVVPTAGAIGLGGPVATIHQDLRLVHASTAMENTLHGALGRHPLAVSATRFPRSERHRAAALLDRVGLAHRRNAPVARLSGGERQRVAIARALMQDPAILLADEPVASLDAANARLILSLLESLRQERGFTLVSVLHDCLLAETFADRIVGLSEGRIVHDAHAGSGVLDPGRPSPGPHAGGLRGFARFEPCAACERLIPSAAASPAGGGVLSGTGSLRYALIALAALLVYASAVAGLGLTGRATEGAAGNVLRFVMRLVPSSWAQVESIDWTALLISLGKTLQMSVVGTSIAAAISLPLAAAAARNVGPQWIRPAARFVLNLLRSVPGIIWALLFVAAVGLGEFAGVLALVAYSIGYLTKLFYEAFEDVDPGPPSALAEIGASGPQRFVHAVWPASRAAVLSSVLFMLEYNVRAASVLGVVGAGGIGYDLRLHIDYGNYHVVGAILLVLGVVAVAIDAVSSRLRHRLTCP